MSVPRKTPRAPLEELALLRREINQLFERLGAGSETDEGASGDWFPGVDVFESKGRLIVQVEVPGLPAEALKVAFRDGQLVVAGERRVRRGPSGAAAFQCVERPHGRFRRSIPIEAAVDLRAAEARLRAGVLTVTLPRLKDRRREETVIPVTREPER